MKPYLKPVFTLLLSVCLFLSASRPAKAQIDSAAIKQHIFVFADSLVRSYYEKDWNTFTALTHPGVARLYGGMTGYVTIVKGIRQRTEDSLEEKKEQVNVKQFLFAGGTWQCIVERIFDTNLKGKNAKVTTYMIGQSKDDLGTEWKFFDVANNLMINISAIMPDFSDELVVPEKKIAYEGGETITASTTIGEPAKPKKKAPGKK
jgi:hypothetical protein